MPSAPELLNFVTGRLDRVGPRWWRAMILAASSALYVVAVSNVAYEATTPEAMTHQGIVRKVYAVLAFALLGFWFERSRFPRFSALGEALSVAAYSGAIEIGQIVIDHSSETASQHGFDIASGLVGGAIGIAFSRFLSPERKGSLTKSFVAIICVALVFLAAAYEVTYGRYKPHADAARWLQR